MILKLQVLKSQLEGLLKVWGGSQEFAFLTNSHNTDTTGPGLYFGITVLDDDFKITFPGSPTFSYSIKSQYEIVCLPDSSLASSSQPSLPTQLIP